MHRKVKIAPSILSADFACLGDQVREAEMAGADLIHVDVMDGHFVPNITIGPIVVEALRKATTLPLDVHLMIENPEKYIENFAATGANMISVHIEASKHLHRLLQAIKAHAGIEAGVAINPATPVTNLEPILGELDFVLVMSVNPGFAGQEFIRASLDKIARLREMIAGQGRAIEIEVDGGIAPETAPDVIAAGADILVAGSAVFCSPNIGQAIRGLKEGAAL
ncbi:MAG: ribulose-phosphate 3-epimerase [Actinobacteria bacterium]|nr:ribulose-phosphate 3-epimerase [Actinomycetota bacterium]